MTPPSGDEALTAALETLARAAAPDVLAQALDGARAQATTILQRRLVDVLLDEAGRAASRSAETPASRLAGPERSGQVAAPPAARRNGCDPGLPATTDQGLYVYGITSGDAGCVTGLTGVEGSATYPIVEDGLVAVVSDLRAHRHGWGIGDDGEPDLALLAPRLEEHEKVLEQILQQGSLLPMRFGTLYASRAVVSELMAANGAALRAALTTVDGKVEWGLTVRWDGRRAAALSGFEAGEGDTAVSQMAGSPGRAYLGRRDAEKVRAQRMAERRARVSADLHHAIDRVAAASVLLPTPPGGHGDPSEAVLRSSYLVARSDRERFEAVIVEGLAAGADVGLNGELTGPWPPYSFADLRLEGVPA
jgi:hypothetical protein